MSSDFGPDFTVRHAACICGFKNVELEIREPEMGYVRWQGKCSVCSRIVKYNVQASPIQPAPKKRSK